MAGGVERYHVRELANPHGTRLSNGPLVYSEARLSEEQQDGVRPPGGPLVQVITDAHEVLDTDITIFSLRLTAGPDTLDVEIEVRILEGELGWSCLPFRGQF